MNNSKLLALMILIWGMPVYTVVERSQMDKIFEQFEIQNTGCVDISCAVGFGKMHSVE